MYAYVISILFLLHKHLKWAPDVALLQVGARYATGQQMCLYWLDKMIYFGGRLCTVFNIQKFAAVS